MVPNADFSQTRYLLRPKRERGVVLIITLIALTLLLLTTIALFRSANSSLLQVGSLGYQRDLNNQAELGIQAAIAQLKTGTLKAPATRYSDVKASNYSAVRLPASKFGVPDELLNSGSTYVNSTNKVNGSNNTTINYIIDRLCDSAMQGQASTINACAMMPPGPGSYGATAGQANNAAVGGVNLTIYRISVRVDGSKNSQIFVQTTIAL
ncbi:hypothetical protein [Silvimonas soli]|uniref:hypothetical protein n=1 Tax=Silvimonas soli TaxID=2980100 RepID=UPI0024B322C6|nr:hypothetical protein [Silvimonas soli]